MLKDLTIENYRLFHKFTLDPIARVNLIVGTNNSGKSSLLEAIYLLAGKGSRSYLYEILHERDEITSKTVVSESPGTISGYQPAHIFYGRQLETGRVVKIQSKLEKPTALTISFGETEEDGRGLRYRLLEFKCVQDGAEPVEQSLLVREDGLLFDPDGLFANPFLVPPPSFASPEQQVGFVTTNYLEYDELAKLWDNITLTPREDQVVESLRILEPDVERISFVSRQTFSSGILLKLKGEGNPIPLGSMGDGMRRVLAVAASLVSVENGILLVDEIDTGLYYGVLTDMWRLILETSVKRNAQVFATTHSWDCVKSFQEALSEVADDELGRLIRLDPQDDHIQATSYSRDELTTAIQHGIEVR